MKRFIQHTLLVLAALFIAAGAAAQTPDNVPANVRCVKTTGDNAKDGTSWTSAKKDIQDAINDLVANGITGEVWVAEGTYTPTETTEASGSQYYRAFKIPAGITVRGGFAGTESSANSRAMTSDAYFGNTGAPGGYLDGEAAKSGRYRHETILSGDLAAGKPATFTWNEKKQQFDAAFFGNSYHVVWFAMNGFDAGGRALPLSAPAKLEGCIVEGGHASTRDAASEHPHMGYGGGIYMVANSFVYNCEVRRCDASRAGGGIYMDGGGIVRRTFVHDCQTLGQGTEYGFGGGICEDGAKHNSKTNPIVVAQSVVVNCVGRLGGGMALLADKTVGNAKFAVVVNSTLITNCTASIEAGGVYTYKGGGVASATIVRNRCNGSGLTQGGVVTGRAGGLYNRDAAYVGNTVIWGNACESNNDVQYASTSSNLASTERTLFYHSAVSKSELTDWAGCKKMGALNIADTNNHTGDTSSDIGYPLFFVPTDTVGYCKGASVGKTGNNLTKTIDWQVSSESFLTHAGIATVDLDNEGLTPAPQGTSYDMRFGTFNSRPTIGAYISQVADIEAATGVTYNGKTYAYAFFVDPDFVYTEDNTGKNGGNWTHPDRFLGNVLDLIAKDPTTYSGKTAIFVKQGVVENVRTSEKATRVRETSLDIPSNVDLFGSFAGNLEGTDLSRRSVVHTPTLITARLMDDYKFNVAHLINLDGVSGVTLDGFKIAYANASSTELANTVTDGAALTLHGATGITLRNLLVSNCTADRGAAVYADGSTIATFENCVFHNNEVPANDATGLIYATGSAELTFQHCDVLRNVGYASYLGASATNNWTNSVFYGNMDRKLPDTNVDAGGGILYALPAFAGNTGEATGSYCMFDNKSEIFNGRFGGLTDGVGDTGNEWQYNLQYAFIDGTGQGYPRFINPTKNSGVTVDGDATYYGRAVSFEPHNNNPMVNMGSKINATTGDPTTDHTLWGTDLTGISRDFGGRPDIGAVENHYSVPDPDIENEYTDGQRAYGAAFYVRDYRNADGTVNYTTGGNGYSWEDAINGNAYYFKDGTHGKQKFKTFSYQIDVTKHSYSEGSQLALPTTRNTSINAVMKSGANYLVYQGTTTLGTTTNIAEATVFTITCTAASNTVTSRPYTIQANYNGQKVYMGYSGTGSGAGFSNNPGTTNRTWYTTTNTDGGKTVQFANKTSNTNRRYLTTTGLGTSGATFNFYEFVDTPTTEKETVTEPDKSSPGTIGLQYAVNIANSAFKNEGGTTAQKKAVYVGSGTYTYHMDTELNETEKVSQPYAYYMQKGVDVYGGFPASGNPGMNEREPKDFETILQPQTTSPYITLQFGSHNGTIGDLGYKPDVFTVPSGGWGSCANSDNTKDKASVGRVLVQPDPFDVETAWDGFTLRHGYLNTGWMYAIGDALTRNDDTTGGLQGKTDDVKVAGGAGALLQANGMLVNCVVTDNLILCVPIRSGSNNTTKIRATGYTNAGNDQIDTYHIAAAGVCMTSNGAGSATLENCEIGRNQSIMKAVHATTLTCYTADKKSKFSAVSPDNLWYYGAGLYQNGGNVYNTVIHDNFAGTIQGTTITNMNASANRNNEMVLGAGAFIAQGNFYNNTVVNNASTSFFHCHFNHCTFAGIHVMAAARIYNSLIADNESYWGYKTWSTASTSPGNGVPISAFKDNEALRSSREPSKVHCYYSFINVEKGKKDSSKNWVDLTSGTTGTENNNNIYINDNGSAFWKKEGNTTAVNVTTETAINYRTYYTQNVYNQTGANQYRLSNTKSPCFNAGTSDVRDVDRNLVTIPAYDAEYTDRVKDCAIDIGAYELNGAADVTPQVSGQQAIYYVTPYGYGNRTAEDPKNAACAEKLQIVLDAAGRYKYLNPQKQVIVKVANDYNLAHDKEGKLLEDTYFTYYATRTTDHMDQDVRVWSIMIPRGVEVWGGYADQPTKLQDDGKQLVKADGTWSNTNNGFTYRDITANPTYFDSFYENRLEKTAANTYHVVTFTDRVYDHDGFAYLKTEAGKVATGAPSTYVELTGDDESIFLHMSDVVQGDVIKDGSGNPVQINGQYVSNRAVIDGIFISGGQADASSNSTVTTANINSYGGAAIVNDFGYVRNCIVIGNSATNGGALALTDHALVSGCLIVDNEATNMGGGIYVFEDGTKLSNGTVIDSKQQHGDPTLDTRMTHVMTSTIVGNRAQQGGGVWYNNSMSANARFNSVAIWQNSATDQANVYGYVNPEQDTEDNTTAEIFFPFAFSSIQNVRASGTNNLNVGNLNSAGVRFVDKTSDVNHLGNTRDLTKAAQEASGEGHTLLENFGYYGLTTYSVLCSSGMPKTMYQQLQKSIAISDVDILNTPRMSDASQFVEIGARALPKVFPDKQLMLRLFVANPEHVNTELATRFMQLDKKADPDSKEEYYSQEGSSFAYPFNFLQDALDYVKMARNGQLEHLSAEEKADARNLPFEIVVGKGYHYPRVDLNGGSLSVWAHTFAIPEGVTLIGGFDPQGGLTIDGNGNITEATFYGRYYQKSSDFVTADGADIYNNVVPIPKSNERTESSGEGKKDISRGNKFGTEEVELGDQTIKFQQWHIQDIADRRAMHDNNNNGIIEPWEFTNQTIISGNAINNELDGVYHVMTAVADEDAVGKMPIRKTVNNTFNGTDKNSASGETGYQVCEEGQQIRLNGLIITGGNALTYLSSALDDYGSYIFYQGAGLMVDGNRYKNEMTSAVFHNSAAYGVGYRDIPVSVTNCQFRNNIAGYGGAISSNGSLSIFASSFEQNMAIGDTEEPKGSETWTTKVSGTPQNVEKVMYPGQGGAIHATHQLSVFNTLFANNEARLAKGQTPTIDLVQHPTFRVPIEDNASATLRAAGGAIMMGSAANHHIVNCDFVRNKANAYPAVFTMNPTVQQTAPYNTHKYSQIINTVAWGNEVNKISDNADYLRAAQLLVNVGKKNRTQDYDPEFTAVNVPSETDLTNANAEANTDWQEAVWFCAYEKGMGFAPNNEVDLRDEITYSDTNYAPLMIETAAKTVKGGTAALNTYYQNCNIEIVADNLDVAGPNFGNPSTRAGYDGFMEGADWSPARFNRLTDNGNGWIKQTVNGSDLAVTFHNDTNSGTPGNNGTDYQGAYPVTHYIDLFPEYKLWLALGNEKYMQATNEEEKQETFINNTSIGKPQKNLPRISPDPTIGIEKAYIDIGVYEYQKQPLLLPGNEVDILWVSTEEHPENGPADGATWSTPTTDLQRAINVLLSSRNGHKKEIRIMEGEYAPITAQSVDGTNYYAFVIDTKSLNSNVITPTGFNDGSNNNQYYAQSLTIKGGYSAELMYEYNPDLYKTVIRQTDAQGAKNDYLLYINDPTLRYAGSTPSIKQDGAIWEDTQGGESNTAKTMPIQIDGVTLINDQATETKGSAIYYKDYPDPSPITEAHSVSVGGRIVYYKDKEEFDKMTDGKHSGQTVNYETEFSVIDNTGAKTITNPAKLVITKTIVAGSGKEGDTSGDASAVYIGQYGGSALIYNSVFHSNHVKPLDAYNTVTVNNTFGLNKGFVRLQDMSGVSVKSLMHNSALWRNNPSATPGTYGKQFSIPEVSVVTTAGETKGNLSGSGFTDGRFTYNAFTGGNTTATDYTSGTVVTNHYNTGLVNDNDNLVNGPNFVDPLNKEVLLRNFDIKPSVRLLNRGQDESITPAESPTGTYFTHVVSDIYDYSLVSTTDKDALYRPRLTGNHIDIGAYEFQGSLNNPLYVDPNKAHEDDATGVNWDKAFGYTDLQNAIDLAALYHMTTPTEEAYVFVKGASVTNPDLHLGEGITLRDGVTVYGSIEANYNDWHEIKTKDNHNNDVDKYSNIPAFIAAMTNLREGVAAHTASKTRITDIKTSPYTVFDSSNGTYPALLDGFVVTPEAGKKPTGPVIDVTNTSENAAIVLRNIIVADNDLSAATGTNVDVARISNGLLYEVLMRDNKPKGNGAVLKVSNAEVTTPSNYTTKAYAVNVTVEGKTIGANDSEPVDGNAGVEAEKTAQIINSITNSIGSAGTPNAGGNAPYGGITNKHISGYFYNIADANLNYQLTETSKYIDACSVDEDGGLGGHPSFLPSNLKPFVTYRTDRDILGNPRLLTGVTTASKIDRGAFETWKVENDFWCGVNFSINRIDPYKTNTADAYTPIKKHYYPHDGSVVYAMEGKSLIIDPFDKDHEVKPTPHNPGFQLVQEGASIYGNGRPMTCAYVAVERTIPNEGAVVSVPYDMHYTTGTTRPQHTDDSYEYLTALATSEATALAYDAAKRSEWDYKFKTTDGSWTTINSDDTVTPANHGVFIAPGSGYGGKTYRFTGKGRTIDDYIYTEDLTLAKTVTLTQEDDVTSTDGAADFTNRDDMGWNCIGLPYLVSDYRPYERVATDFEKSQVTVDNTPENDAVPYRLDNPHVLWLYYDGTVGPNGANVNGDGGFYSVNSWENTKAAWHVNADDAKRIWVGEGIFVQTATTGADEDLTFYLPTAPPMPGSSSSNRKEASRLIRYYYDLNAEQDAEPEEELNPLAPVLIRTEYYHTSGRRIARPAEHDVTIIRDIYSDGTTRTRKVTRQ